jgi:hypothetical protein
VVVLLCVRIHPLDYLLCLAMLYCKAVCPSQQVSWSFDVFNLKPIAKWPQKMMKA